MAMKKCPACGHQVSSSARACPQCGDNLAARNSWWWVLAIFAVIPIAGFLAVLREPDQVSHVVPAAPQPAASIQQVATRVIIASDLAVLPSEYREDVAPFLAVLARDIPSCRKRLDPYNVGLSSKQSNRANPAFFAQCGEGAGIEVLHFTWMDAVNKTVPAQPAPLPTISERQAADACERHAKSSATIPATVDFSRFWDSAFQARPDGTATYASKFGAKNAFGVEHKYSIRCHFKGMTLADVNVHPSD